MAVFRDHSSYYYQLPVAAAHRYDEKISVIGNVDPFIIDKVYFHDDVGTWPQVCYMDIVDSLVYKSFVTQEEMRAKKGPPALQILNRWDGSRGAVCYNQGQCTSTWQGEGGSGHAASKLPSPVLLMRVSRLNY